MVDTIGQSHSSKKGGECWGESRTGHDDDQGRRPSWPWGDGRRSALAVESRVEKGCSEADLTDAGLMETAMNPPRTYSADEVGEIVDLLRDDPEWSPEKIAGLASPACIQPDQRKR